VGRSKIRPVCDRGVKLVLHTRETDGTVTDGLIFDSNGALYGTTSTGGSSKNDGTVFTGGCDGGVADSSAVQAGGCAPHVR
jgi:hypothetical protein